MPRYEFECPLCREEWERQLPLSRCDEEQYQTHFCLGGELLRVRLRKILNKLTTSCKGKDRHWGRSLYRSHDRGEKIGKQKRKEG